MTGPGATPPPVTPGAGRASLEEYAAVVLTGTGLDLTAAAAIAAGHAEPVPGVELPVDAVDALRAAWHSAEDL